MSEIDDLKAEIVNLKGKLANATAWAEEQTANREGAVGVRVERERLLGRVRDSARDIHGHAAAITDQLPSTVAVHQKAVAIDALATTVVADIDAAIGPEEPE